MNDAPTRFPFGEYCRCRSSDNIPLSPSQLAVVVVAVVSDLPVNSLSVSVMSLATSLIDFPVCLDIIFNVWRTATAASKRDHFKMRALCFASVFTLQPGYTNSFFYCRRNKVYPIVRYNTSWLGCAVLGSSGFQPPLLWRRSSSDAFYCDAAFAYIGIIRRNKEVVALFNRFICR